MTAAPVVSQALPAVAAYCAGVQVATLRQWVYRGHISAPVDGLYNLNEVQQYAIIWHDTVDQFRRELATPLPRSQLLTVRDLALLVEVDVNTIHVWVKRGILTRRAGRYDWRQAALWLMERNPGKISEPLATRASL